MAPDRAPQPRQTQSRIGRYLIAIGVVAAATLFRFALDPLLHDQVPYFVYVASVVIATWFAGAEGGVVSVVAGAFVGNYFFVAPRDEVNLTASDAAAMATFAALSLGLVWLVTRWRRAERDVRELHSRTDMIIRALPVGVVVADTAGNLIFSNAAAERVLRTKLDSTRVVNVADYRKKRDYTPIRRNGTIITPQESTLTRALKGETVSGDETHIVWSDGTRTIVSGHAAPLRDASGQVVGAVLAAVDITEQQATSEASRQRAEELQTILDTVPAAVFITRDPDARRMEGNRFTTDVLRLPLGSNVSRTAPDDQRPATFLATHGGTEIPGQELPVQVAAARGVEVRDAEVDLTYTDGTVRTLFGNASPLRGTDGTVRGAVGAFVDVTDLKRLEAELQRQNVELERRVAELAESEARYKTMGETLPYGVWLSDPQGRAVYTSESFLELLNMTQEEQQQFGWTQRLVPEDVVPMMDKWLHCVATGELWDHEHRIIDRRGRIHTVLTRGLPVRDAEGRITCWVGVNLDITDRKVMEQRVRQQAEELGEANRMKDEFLATLSHELRTPLNAIVGWSDMLRRGNLPPDTAQRAVESIYRNAKVQNQLINDVLDVSRIISGKLRIDTQPIDPVAVVEDAIESVRSAADAKGVAVTSALMPSRFPIAGDPTRLQQVFWNLLSNAVKFTPTGGHVRVSLTFTDDRMQVQVADTGIGISPGFLPHVFDRFRQRDSSMTRTQGGLGLGLAIVRHLVELHGGTVRAESAGEGKGATFTLVLPARPFEERRHGVGSPARRMPVPAVDPVPDEVPGLRGVHVLVVDDEDDAREVTASVLRHHGASVTVAANAARALEAFAASQPNVLLVDLAMPEVDGYTLIRSIRQSRGGKGATVPAIALTAYAREEDQRRTLASGFQMHLPKPVDAHTLVRAVADVCRRTTANDQRPGA